MRILGLTGGIAAGKSVVARRLNELGAVHVDADALAREVVEPGTPALEAIRRRFGDGVLAPDGSLDRPVLGAIVFSDADARADLNRITHPAVRRRSQELFA
ncbi:MAG: dephospho-CoA kinase, partial [Actinomycetota bacterium]|nr:dephospho-CoA kinase [Actinomycetota bacterium]